MASKTSFTVSESIRYGWRTFKKNWQFLLIVFAIVLFATMIPNSLHDWSRQNAPQTSFIFSIIGWIIQMITSIGVIAISLKLVDKKKAEFEDIYKHYNFLLNYFFGSIIYAAIFLVGLILLIVPGIIWGIKYQLFSYYIIDKKMGPWEAMKASSKATQGHKKKLFLLDLSFLGISILGVLALGIGVLVSWPIISLAGAYVYRKLSS